MKFEKILYLSTEGVRSVIGDFLKLAVKGFTYSVAIIYASALVSMLVSMLVPVEVTVISSTGIIGTGILVGSIAGKVLWNHVIKKIFEGIDRGIVKVRNRICKNLIFCNLMKKSTPSEEDIMEVLNYAPNVNVNIDESTPLTIAVEMGSISVIDKLIELGADINALDRPEKDMLLRVEYERGDKNIMDILYSKGANFVEVLYSIQDVITDEYFYGVVKQYMIKEERGIRGTINKFLGTEKGFSKDVLEKINKLRVFLDTSKKVVKANNFRIRNLEDTSKFRDIWLQYNYYLNQNMLYFLYILCFYNGSTKRYTNELQNNEIQRVNTDRHQAHGKRTFFL